MKVRDNGGEKDSKVIRNTTQVSQLASKSSNVIEIGRARKATTSESNNAIQQAIKYSKSLGW